MLLNIWVKDNCTGTVHQVGTDPHDNLELFFGQVHYVNLQCCEGTFGGGYSFVEPPNMDDYVSVTPDILRVNREYLHKDVLKILEEHPEIFDQDEEESE